MSPCITPLHLSCCRGTKEDIRQLNEVLNVDPQALNRLQHSLSFEFALPLMCAAEACHSTCIAALVERGADVNAMDKEGRQAIYYAIRSGSSECVEVLISSGAEINYMENGSPTTRYLEMACNAGYSDVMEVLLRRGAISVDPKMFQIYDPNINTPMTLAIVDGQVECLKWLLLYGAQTDFSNVPNIRRDSNNLFRNLTEPDLRCSLEQRKEMFRIVYEFGFEMTVSIIQTLQKNVERARDKPTMEALIVFVTHLLYTPRTLQSASRVMLIKTLGLQHYASRVKELKVTLYNRSVSESRLNNYLYFHED